MWQNAPKFNHTAPVVDAILNANHALTEFRVILFATKEGKKLPHTAINRSALWTLGQKTRFIHHYLIVSMLHILRTMKKKRKMWLEVNDGERNNEVTQFNEATWWKGNFIAKASTSGYKREWNNVSRLVKVDGVTKLFIRIQGILSFAYLEIKTEGLWVRAMQSHVPWVNA